MKVQIPVRVQPELKKQLEAEAQKESRSLSNFIELTLNKSLKNKKK
jgi:predicted HicB family RNase H-like nuclease